MHLQGNWGSPFDFHIAGEQLVGQSRALVDCNPTDGTLTASTTRQGSPSHEEVCMGTHRMLGGGVDCYRSCKWVLGQDHLIPKEFGDYIMCACVQCVQVTLSRSLFLEAIF